METIMQLFICPSLPEIVYDDLLLTAIYITVLGFLNHQKKQRNPLQADLGTVCDFLTEQFEDSKKSYSTINSYRSALSSMLLPVDGYSVGEHPIT
ncbi:hypothetical protein P5673_007349 [Acropora cervicornis]|uniref:Uncharacterized protein n=1 Tax=Acropora cervicornis TaxID=6130 RepID=A0AAD9QVU5_ACRCE|nr:hypothetical protein P5673_007349 [Acropora cervicornis]